MLKKILTGFSFGLIASCGSDNEPTFSAAHPDEESHAENISAEDINKDFTVSVSDISVVRVSNGALVEVDTSVITQSGSVNVTK